MTSLILIAATLSVAALLVAAVTSAARRRWRQSGVAMMVCAVVVTAYGLSLVVVSASAPGHDLAIGEWKCFDEWCVSLTTATRSGNAIEVALSVQNRGRRDQAPDTPRVWLLHDGQRDELEVPGLTSRVPGGSTRELPRIRVIPPGTGRPRLLVTEGGFPSILVIGDDNSPFHPQPSWPLP